MLITPDKRPDQDTQDVKLEPAGSPPPYEASASGAGPSTVNAGTPSSFQSPPMRSNFVQLITPNRSIRSTAVLDLGLPPHPGPSRTTRGDFQTHDGSRPNLYLSSQHNTVQTSLQIVDCTASAGPPAVPKRCFIVVESDHGNVTVEIVSRVPSAKLHICAESKHGNVIIRLPRDFHGPVRCRTNQLQSNPLRIRLTPRIRSNMTALSIDETEAYGFIGDFPTPSPPVVDANQSLGHSRQYYPGSVSPNIGTPVAPVGINSAWTGDQVEVIANNGRVKICYTLLEGEEKESEGELETLVRHVQENGPIAALVKFAARGVTKAIQNSKKRNEHERSG